MRKLLAALLVLAITLPAAAQQPASPDTQLTRWQRVMAVAPRTQL